MADQRVTKVAGDYLRRFFSQDGRHFRRETQEIGPAIKRVEEIRHLHDQATRASNPNEWRHKGSIPMSVLIEWLTKNGFTIDQWARNDGGIPGKRYPHSRSGVKDKFLAYFLSRDFSKLHNEHVTTKRPPKELGRLRRQLEEVATAARSLRLGEGGWFIDGEGR